jgi:Ca-activated chloride channel family protein
MIRVQRVVWGIRAIGAVITIMVFRSIGLLAIAVIATAIACGPSFAASRAVLLLDSSNSMWAEFETGTKSTVTQQVLTRALETRAGAFELGVISYGHRSKDSCVDIHTVVPVGPIDPGRYSAALARLKPQGRTPISGGLTAAVKALKAGSEPSAIVLIADGLDNCRPDPCATSAALKAASSGLAIHVIALAVPPESHAKLSCMASNTGGSFAKADSRRELEAAVDTAFRLVVEAPTPQATAEAGNQDAPPTLDMPVGTGAAEAASLLGVAAGETAPAEPQEPSKWVGLLPPQPRPNPRGPFPAPEPAEAEAPVPDGPDGETSPDAVASDGEGRAIAALSPAAPSGEEITGAIPEPTPPDMAESEMAKVVPREIDTGDRAVAVIPDAVRPAYLVAEDVVAAGKESLRLRARITAATDPIARPIAWTVHRVDDSAEDKWPLVGERSAAEVAFDLAPGQYVVRAGYGAIKAAKVVVIQPRQQVDVTFILNAGGLRVVPALAFLDPPEGLNAKHWVFEAAADDRGNRRLFAEADRPGEVIRLNAGTYHLISRFGSANAVVEADVTVKPGMLTEVEINHKAGIVHLGFARHDTDGPPESVQWQVNDSNGAVIMRANGARISQILAPGDYIAEVDYGGRKFEARFEIDIGETKEVNITGE